jgi:hypothetical protein
MTTAQAKQAGLTREQLSALIARGWQRPTRGVYVSPFNRCTALTLHSGLRAGEKMTVHGFPVTSLARTVFDMASVLALDRLAEDGWKIFRVTWDDLVRHPERIVALIRKALYPEARGIRAS